MELAFLPEVLDEAGRYGVHPAVLDGCLQASAALMEAEAPTAPALPASVAAYRVLGDGDGVEVCYVYGAAAAGTHGDGGYSRAGWRGAMFAGG